MSTPLLDRASALPAAAVSPLVNLVVSLADNKHALGLRYAEWCSSGPTIEAAADQTERTLRHIAIVRVTHWIMAAGVLGLLVTGGGILISHPRLYWGETGSIATPSLVDLPLPFVIGP